jgi:hypothetical protein
LKYYFGSYKTKAGVELKTEKEMMEIEAPIYVITPEGELPAPEGDYELENGMVIKVKDGMIKELMTEKIEETMEDKKKETMVEATLVDGTKITNDLDADFEVGQMLYVITEAGDRVPAPEGEHTTESGITLVVDGEGKITGLAKPDEEKEGSLDMNSAFEMLSSIVDSIEKLNSHFNSLKNKQEVLESSFSKFSQEPAGEKVYTNKVDKPMSTNDKLEMFSKLKTKLNK